MRLSWNEIRARAARFAEDWADTKYEKGETQSFYNDFFINPDQLACRPSSRKSPIKLSSVMSFCLTVEG